MQKVISKKEDYWNCHYKHKCSSYEILLTWCLVAKSRCLSSSSSAILRLAAANCSSSSVSLLCDLSRSSLSSRKSDTYTAFCCFSTATSLDISSNCLFNSLFAACSVCFSCNSYNEIHEQKLELHHVLSATPIKVPHSPNILQLPLCKVTSYEQDCMLDFKKTF